MVFGLYMLDGPLSVLVCGGRNFDVPGFVFKTLDDIHVNHKIKRIIHGGAKGADKLAGVWAKENSIEEIVEEAQWNKYGKRAGYLRNKKMITEHHVDLVVAFPGGRGTENMIKLSEESFVKVIRA